MSTGERLVDFFTEELAELCLAETGRTLPREFWFAFSSALKWQSTIGVGARRVQIARSELLDGATFAAALSERAVDGPSWVHANLVWDSEGAFVAEVTVGKTVGNPNPTPNISVERNPVEFEWL